MSMQWVGRAFADDQCWLRPEACYFVCKRRHLRTFLIVNHFGIGYSNFVHGFYGGCCPEELFLLFPTVVFYLKRAQ